MPGFDADQLAQMRSQVTAEMLPDTGVIQAPARTSDGAGGMNVTYAPVTGGTVACRIDPLPKRGSIITIPGREGLVVEYILSLPYDAPIAANDRFVHQTGQTYEILMMAKEHSWNVSRRAYIARVDP